MSGPLVGTRVIDLSRYIAGPLCAQLLGDFGAEVIKVEGLRGEEGRQVFPLYEGYSLYYANFNRNKLGVTLNLRTEKGKDLLRELVVKSDVLVQNFRVGVMEQMGLAYPQLSEINPRLVMVNISGFGRSSARAQWPVYDEIAQAMSGLMGQTGQKDGMPTLVGTAIVDQITGIYSALGAVSALEQRWHTGLGQQVDVSLVNSAMSTLMTHIPWFLLTGESVPRSGNAHPLQAAHNTYPTLDGYVHIVCPTNAMWTKLCKVIGRDELAVDPNFSTTQARRAQREEIDEIIAAWTIQRTCQDATEALSVAGVACGPVRTISDVATDPEVHRAGLLLDVITPQGRTVQVMGNPVHLSGAPIQVRSSPPALGEHNGSVYCGLLGHSTEHMEALREEEVI